MIDTGKNMNETISDGELNLPMGSPFPVIVPMRCAPTKNSRKMRLTDPQILAIQRIVVAVRVPVAIKHPPPRFGGPHARNDSDVRELMIGGYHSFRSKGTQLCAPIAFSSSRMFAPRTSTAESPVSCAWTTSLPTSIPPALMTKGIDYHRSVIRRRRISDYRGDEPPSHPEPQFVGGSHSVGIDGHVPSE